MIRLLEVLTEWQTPMFADIFQREIKKLDVDQLLLQQALQYGSHAITDGMKIIILSTKDDETCIYVKIAMFYNSMIPGCQCDDDPSSMNVENEYCELLFSINKLSAETKVEITS